MNESTIKVWPIIKFCSKKQLSYVFIVDTEIVFRQ